MQQVTSVQEIAEAVAARLSPGFQRARVTLTFGELFQRYLTDYVNVHSDSIVRRNYERLFKNHFSEWKDLAVYDIHRSEVQSWMSRLAENIGNTTANHARELMRQVYNFAISNEIIPDNYNPAAGIRKFATMKRDRFLQADELPRFFQALQTLRYDATRDCLLLCLLTAQRLGNVRTMQWNQIDFERDTWTIPRTKTTSKTGMGHVVALTPDAMAILKRRQIAAMSDERKAGSVWVFPSYRDATKAITKLERAWGEVCKRAGIDNLRIHDLRRSHASWQAITGANISVIAKTLNHTDLNSTAIYARLNIDDQRRAMVTATRAMLTAAGVDSTAEEPDAPALMKLGPAFEMDPADEWVSEKDAAEIVGMSISRLKSMRTCGDGPPYLKTAGCVRYKASLLRAWLHERSTRSSCALATKEELDCVQEFAAWETVEGALLTVETKQLYAAYLQWCARNAHKPFSKVKFGRCMSALGWSNRKYIGSGANAKYVYVGLGLVSEARHAE